MPSKTRSEAEAWLRAGEPVSGALAWDRAGREQAKASRGVQAAAVALVSPLPVASLKRVRAVEALLLRLEQVEGDSSPSRRKHG